jgi:hypothetical protein
MNDPNMKEILRNVSRLMENDNCLLYKSKTIQNWYKWEKSSNDRPVALPKEERHELLLTARIINWGNYILQDNDNIILNKPSSCKLSSNKWETRKVWQANGIKTPLSSNSFEDMIDFPFIARPYKHCCQSEFHVINNLRELVAWQNEYDNANARPVGDWYFQKIVQKDCEFRVYVIGDKVATIFWKDNGDQLLSSNSVWHWLDDVNWNLDKLPSIFYVPETNILVYSLDEFKEDIAKIKEECIKATKILRLDYSGIDVGLNSGTREFNLFESNTNPELTPLPQKKFAKYFDSVLNRNISGNV